MNPFLVGHANVYRRNLGREDEEERLDVEEQLRDGLSGAPRWPSLYMRESGDGLAVMRRSLAGRGTQAGKKQSIDRNEASRGCAARFYSDHHRPCQRLPRPGKSISIQHRRGKG